MKIKKWTNKQGEIETNVLLEKVKIVYSYISKPNDQGEYADNKYGCQVLIPKDSEDAKILISLFNEIASTNNGKLVPITSKYFPLKKKNLEDIKNKLETKIDENKKRGYEKYFEYSTGNYFMKLSSNYEIPTIDLEGKEVENLEDVKFNDEFVNIQFKIRQPKGKPYYNKFLQGIQLQEVKRFEKGLMFDVNQNQNSEIEDDDTLPF